MPTTISFDAAEIVATVEAIRPERPAAAKLIEDLWAEVRRMSADDYVSPPRQLTEADRSGPYLAEPQVDIEFFDTSGNTCGWTTANLAVKINDSGLMIISDHYIGFMPDENTDLGGYWVWVGNQKAEARLATPRTVYANCRYLLELNLPIKLGSTIGHSEDGSGRGPPRPIQPDPRAAKVG